MTDLKQQLEVMRDRMAEQHYKEKGHVATEWAVMNYQAGFNAAIPIILKAVEQRNDSMKYRSKELCGLAVTVQNQELLKQFVDGGK